MSKRRQRMVYVWEGVVNCDWSCGDAIVIAFSVEEARQLVGNTSWSKDAPNSVEPVSKFVYFGPGGA